ncbi:MAG TPA: hypothetical protein DDW67_04580 [Elusimicrobia bacterium]|nr:hypothetical protein [Elusimicrobiota bacterium]
MNWSEIDLSQLMRYFWVLAYAAVIGIAYLVGKLAVRKRLARLREIAPYLGAQAVSGFLGPRLEGVKGGRNFVVAVVPGGKNSPPVIRLTIDSFLPVPFSVQRPDMMTGLMGVFIKQAPTGDQDFDDKFFASSPDPLSFAAFFADSRRRAAARRLLERGYARVESKKGKASANMPAVELEAELEPAKISAALDDLAELSA